MGSEYRHAHTRLLVATVCIGLALTACGSKEQPAQDQAPPAAPAATDPAAAAPSAPPLAATDQTWEPEAMEALLAPIALYPDPVLSQVLLASTNPQEVLDAGNWLVGNPDAEGKALDQAAEEAGFTPPVRALMQFRQVVDQMCLEMGWTTELGQAFTNDEAGVFAAVQRLRQQAQDVGNLQSSAQMKVEEKTENGQEAIIISPPSPEVVYVPTYDPVAAYAPPPATAVAAAPAAAPVTTTTTTTTEEDKGHSTGSMVATGLLAFGAGLLVSEIFEDDDDDYYGHDYYYPNYHGGYMPPPPPYYYRPVYGNGYHPNNNYNRPNQYNKVLSDNNVVVVNNDNRNNNYWGGYDDRPTGKPRAKQVNSPISSAKSNRPELSQLNAQAQTPRAAQQPTRSTGAKPDWKGQTGYAGANPEVRAKAKLPPPSKATTSKTAANAASARTKASQQPANRSAGTSAAKTADRGYGATAGRSAAAARPAATSKATSAARAEGVTRPANVPASMPSRPKPTADTSSRSRGNAMSGSSHGSADRAASQRGKKSMPQGAHSKGGAAKGKRR